MIFVGRGIFTEKKHSITSRGNRKVMYLNFNDVYMDVFIYQILN